MNIEQGKQQLQLLQAKYEKEEQELLDNFTQEERKELGHPIKGMSRLSTFKANGVNYVVRDSLALGRFEEFEETRIGVGYNIDFKNLFQRLNEVWKNLNEGQPMDAGVIVHNLMNATKSHVEKKENAVFIMCTLFICREDEDIRYFDKAIALQKIKDWKDEGIDANHFFDFAFGLTSRFIPGLNEASGNISETVLKLSTEAKRQRENQSEKSI